MKTQRHWAWWASLVVTVSMSCTQTLLAEESISRRRDLLWQESPNLSANQKEMLHELRTITLAAGGEFGAEVWDEGRSVFDLQVLVPPENSGADIAEIAKGFLEKYGDLWTLSMLFQRDGLVTIKKHEEGDCSVVVFQMESDSKRVFNATLTVRMREDGTIHRVTGYMDGSPVEAELPEVTIERELAQKALVAARAWPDEAAKSLPEPELVIFDRRFVTGGGRKQRHAWYFELNDNANGGLLVDATDGALLVNGASLPESQILRKGLCENAVQHTVWVPRVVLESEDATVSPSLISFENFGGYPASSQNQRDSVIELMSSREMRKIFGDAAPAEHLKLEKATSDLLTFAQFYDGIRVEGGYLQAVFRGGRIQELHSRLAYFPFHEPARKSEGDALDAAATWYADVFCQGLQPGEAIDDCVASIAPLSETTVILAPEIIGHLTTQDTELTRRIDFEHATVWWSLSRGELAFWTARSPRLTTFRVWQALAVRSTCPARGPCATSSDFPANRYKIDRDLAGGLFAPLHPSTTDMAAGFGQMDDTLRQEFSWNSVLGDGRVTADNPSGNIEIVLGITTPSADAQISRAGTYGAGLGRTLSIELGEETTSLDVMGHEYMHHITGNTYGPIRKLEQGAISESYSDMLGVTMFPQSSGGWEIGADTAMGAIRNLLTPRAPNTAEGNAAVDNADDLDDCDSTRVDCIYQWTGVPNRAFALIASGVPGARPGTSPLGRLTTAKLYFETLRADPGARMMQSADRFLNQRLKLEQVCRQAALGLNASAAQRWAGSRVISLDDCANISAAFDAVGVRALVRSGWDRYDVAAGSGPIAGDRRDHVGLRLTTGCSISGHILRAEVRRGAQVFALSRSSSDTPALDISYANGEFTARVTHRCGGGSASACPDPEDREIWYEFASKWDAQETNVFVDEEFAKPAWITDDRDCIASQVGNPLTVFQSTPISSLLTGFIVGDSKSVPISPTYGQPTLLPPCDLREVGVVDEHRQAGQLVYRPFHPLASNPEVPTVASGFPHGTHGLYVEYVGNHVRDYDSVLHLWSDAFSGVFGRLVYVVSGPPNFSCGFQGNVYGLAPLPPPPP